MMSRLPLLLDDGGVHSILAIAAHHNTLGVSSLLGRTMGRTKATTGTGPPEELGGHCSMGA